MPCVYTYVYLYSAHDGTLYSSRFIRVQAYTCTQYTSWGMAVVSGVHEIHCLTYCNQRATTVDHPATFSCKTQKCVQGVWKNGVDVPFGPLHVALGKAPLKPILYMY